MVNTVKLSSGKSHYNPPEYYAKITNADTFINENVINSYDVECPISQNIGTVRVPFSANNFKTTVVTYIDNDCNYVYVGTVKNIARVSATELVINFDIDWYTSQACSFYKFTGNKGIVAKSMNVRRVTDGEYTWISDGIAPQYTKLIKKQDNVFATALTDCTYLLIYHDTYTNVTLWFIADSNSNSIADVKDMYEGAIWSIQQKSNTFDYERYITDHPFNPKSVLYFGYIPVKYEHMPTLWSKQTSSYGDFKHVGFLMQVDILGSSSYNGYYKTYSKDIYFNITDGLTSTEFDEYTIRGTNNEVLFEFPKGREIPSILTVTVSTVFDTSQPSITFKFNSTYWYNEQKSFTIPFYALPFVIDAGQVYIAEEKVYAKEMRNIQTLNNLVSGVTGAVTTGTMVYGFSRGGNSQYDATGGKRTGLTGAQKGMLGGGIGMASALGTAVYDYAYANKEAEAIEERKAKVTADTVLLSGSGSLANIINAGIFHSEYDIPTKGYIISYHNKFGYKSNRVSTDYDLISRIPSTRYYIQADVMIVNGLRKDVENYIINMFANGVTFNE